MKQNLSLTWKGIFFELCMARVQPGHKDLLQVHVTAADADHKQIWYENAPFLQSHFNTKNWWAIDDLDHVMGLVFEDRLTLEENLSSISFAIDGRSVTVDPKALQMHFYAPEAHPPLKDDEWILRHGTSCRAELTLKTEIRPPFDPELLTFSLIQYPDMGYVLIDLDYDGHDELQFTWGEKTYLPPRITGKENLHGTSNTTQEGPATGHEGQR